MERKTMIKKIACILMALTLVVTLFSGRGASALSRPKKPSFTVSKRTKKTATVTIKKKGTVTGYHVYVKKGKKGKYRLWTFSFTRKFKLTKLSSKSVYYVKIRSYRTRRGVIKKSKYSSAKKIGVYKKKTTSKKKTSTPKTTVTQIPAPEESSTTTESSTPAESSTTTESSTPAESSTTTESSTPTESTSTDNSIENESDNQSEVK